MMFEYVRPDGKRPDDEEVPTRVSVGGREYDVKDGCFDGPAKFEGELKLHGFAPRTRDRVVVRDPGNVKK